MKKLGRGIALPISHSTRGARNAPRWTSFQCPRSRRSARPCPGPGARSKPPSPHAADTGSAAPPRTGTSLRSASIILCVGLVCRLESGGGFSFASTRRQDGSKSRKWPSMDRLKALATWIQPLLPPNKTLNNMASRCVVVAFTPDKGLWVRGGGLDPYDMLIVADVSP